MFIFVLFNKYQLLNNTYKLYYESTINKKVI